MGPILWDIHSLLNRWTCHIGVLLICAATLNAVMPHPSCPPECQCSSRGRKVICEKQKLQSVPDNIPLTVTELYLGFNLINVLRPNAFSNLTKLHTLSLVHNLLTSGSVHVNAFRGLTSLRYLFLTNNKLSKINKELFRDLTGMTRLYLSQNTLTEIPDLGYCTSLSKFGIDNNKLKVAHFPEGFTNLTALSTLVLGNNPLTSFTFDDVQCLLNCSIRMIDLGRCSLKTVDVETFTAFPHLQSLHLSYNSDLTIMTLRNIINGLRHSQLTYLGLSNVVKSTTIPPDLFANFTQVPLKTLDMSHMDNVNIIENGTFRYLVQLEFLDISHSKLVIITDGAFGDEHMKLNRLILAHNNIAVVPTGLPSSLEILDISHNSPEKLIQEQFANLHNLKNLSMAYCRIQTVSQDAFVGVSSLISLDMSYNQIGGNNLGNKVFYPLGNLRTLNLRGNIMTDISTEFKLFEQLSSLIELDLSENKCSDLDANIFRNQTFLKKLDLSQNTLGDFIQAEAGVLFSTLVNLEVLILKQNGLYQLPTILFSNLVSLRKLDLQTNDIAEWEGGLFANTHKLSDINLRHNNIAVINETSMNALPDKVKLDLTHNPFACWCDLIWFRNWLDEFMNESRISLPGNETYLCHSPKSMLNHKVLEFHPITIKDECNPPPWVKILIGCMAGVAGLIIGVVFVIYKNRWSLQLRMYRWKKSCGLQKQHRPGYTPIPGDDEEPSYDICVSYGPSLCDCKWVKEELVPHFEVTLDGKWKIFFEERDVLPNMCAIGQISEAIYSSKKIILVLSTEYVNNSRRDYEMKQVFSALEERHQRVEDTIIPIVLEENVKVKVPRLLHPMFNANLELTWTESESGQMLLWNKLDDIIKADQNNAVNINA